MKQALVLIFLIPQIIFAQNTKLKLAIAGVDSKGIINTPSDLITLTRIEMDKLNIYETIDKYDQNDVFAKNNIQQEGCVGKSCMLEAGKALGAQKVLAGSVERIAEKIIISYRILDVASASIENSQTIEFINLQEEIQRMIMVTLSKLFNKTIDPKIEEKLIYYDADGIVPVTTLRLNGPRIGTSVTLGENGKRLMASKNQGGFDMFPITSLFGWQQEAQYLSAGNFQALLEFIFLAGGMETGRFLPSLTFLNGFRNSATGLEFAIGPTFTITRTADGFYDTQGLYGKKDNWYTASEYYNISPSDTAYVKPFQNPYPIVNRIDSRGSTKLTTALLIAAGKTFRSGYLNMPVNVYFSPRKAGSVIGLSIGFNVSRKRK
jgi:hypothetical protein